MKVYVVGYDSKAKRNIEQTLDALFIVFATENAADHKKQCAAGEAWKL